MSVVDTLITKYQMDNRSYVHGADQIQKSTVSTEASIKSMKATIHGATTVITTFIGGVTAAATALTTLGAVSFQRFAQFDAMVKGLEAIQGSSEKAAESIKKLREIASRPGLGLNEAIMGFGGLRRAGLEDSQAYRILGAAGNANALAGGGREDLSRILLAITQIAMKPNLSGEELMQLNEGGIPGSKIISDKFGTFDGAKLQKMGVDSKQALEALVEGMEKMPKAADSAKNTLENLAMGIDMALVDVGSGLSENLLGPLNGLVGALGKVEEGGLFTILGEKMGEIASVTFPEIFDFASNLESTFVDLAAVVANVAEALGNLYLNLDDIIKFGRKVEMFNPLTAPVAIVRDAVWKYLTNDAPGVPSAGQQLKNEYDAKNDPFTPAGKARRAKARGFSSVEEMDKYDAERKAAKEKGGAGTPPPPEKDPFGQPSMTIKYLAAIERNTEVTARSIAAFSIGGSAHGEHAFNTVNIHRMLSGGNSGGGLMNLLATVMGPEISRQIAANNRRVGY